MAVTTTPYRKALASLLSATVNFTADSIKAMLLTSTYTPNLDTHQFKSDLTNEVVATGYVATGTVLAAKSVTYTAANTWGQVWTVGTVYAAGQVVRPITTNTHLYLCQTGGTAHATTEPTWPTVRGAEVADNTITWEELAFGITVMTSGNPSWANSTITARYCAFYDSTPGTDATRPLLALVDFGSDVATTNGTFQVTVDTVLGILNFPSR